jgi:hypothetical protein
MSELENIIGNDNTEGILLYYPWVKLLYASGSEDAKEIVWHLICHVMGENLPKLGGMAGGVCDMIEEAVDIGRVKRESSRSKQSEGGKLGGKKSGETRRRKKADAESQTIEIPTLADVETYAEEHAKTHGEGMPASRFFEYFSNREWKDLNGNDIKDWRRMYEALSRKFAEEKTNTPSYDIDLFIELAMNRSFEDVD